jgi:hypothetical protein
MTEDAPYATDHDDDGKRLASSYSYDLPNQEPNQNDDYQDERKTNFDKYIRFIKEWKEEIMSALSSWPLSNTNEAKTNVSVVPSSILNAVDELTRFIEDNLPDKANKCNEDTYLLPGLLTPFDRIENILDELTMFMKEDEIKPIRMRERRRRNECEKLYYLKALKGIYTPQKSEAEVLSNKDATTLINKTEIALSTKAIKSKVGISTQSNNISAV